MRSSSSTGKRAALSSVWRNDSGTFRSSFRSFSSSCGGETVSSLSSEKFCARAERALASAGQNQQQQQQEDPEEEGDHDDTDAMLRLRAAPFVGREREMADLQEVLDQLCNGDGSDGRSMFYDDSSDGNNSINEDRHLPAAPPPKVVSIEGPPGAGKTRLAQQLRPLVVENNHGYFIRGKFDENSAAAPYSGLAMAMEDLADQIVERDWDMTIRRKLREFLQGNETILFDVFPGLDKLILTTDEDDNEDEKKEETETDTAAEDIISSTTSGEISEGYPYNKIEQPAQQEQQQLSYCTPIESSAPTTNNLRSEKEAGAQRSKRRVFFFQQFFHAVLVLNHKTQRDNTADDDNNNHIRNNHPNPFPETDQGVQKPPCIVLQLDDVQWASKESLELISSLVRDPDLGSFLLITTSRPITDPDHLLQRQMKCWQSEGVPVKRYPLHNLCITGIEALVAYCLDCGTAAAAEDNSASIIHNGSDIMDVWDTNNQNSNSGRLTTFPLAQIIHQRTEGNPFYAVEFLKSLVDRRLLSFSYSEMNWKWDIDKVHTLVLTMTDSPVDLLISKAKRLPPDQQLVLLVSSCLGGTFKAKLIRKVLKSLFSSTNIDNINADTPPLLALLNESNTTKDISVLDTLHSFVHNGFMDRTGPSFFFVHDLIRQAAMEFVSQDEIQWIRLQVGQCILQTMGRPQQQQPQRESPRDQYESSAFLDLQGHKIKNESNLFLGVDLCNIVAHLFNSNTNSDNSNNPTTNLSLVDLARFNCRAGEKAMGESAFLDAVKYLKMGIRHLQQQQERPSNEEDEALMAKLVALAAEASYCSGDYEDMNSYAEQILNKNHLCSEETRVRMLLFKVQSSAAQDFAAEALDIGYAALQELGMATFPRHPKPYHVVIELLKTKKVLRKHTLESLCDLPIVSDKRREAAMEFLNAMKGPAAVSNQDFLIVTFLKSIRWGIKYGLGKHSPGGFSIYGTILNAMFGETQNAIMYGEVALSLADRMDLQETTAETSVLTFAMLRHWTSDMKSCYAPLVYAQKLAAECGDIETVTYALMFGSLVLWCTAMVSLPGMGRQLQRSCAMCRDFKHWSMLEVLLNLGIHLRRLCCDKVNSSFSWLDDDPSLANTDRSSVSKKTAAPNDPTIELFYECMALQSHFLLGERSQALQCAKSTHKMGTELCIGQSYVPRTQFYRALVYLAGTKVTMWHCRQAKRALSLLKRWANNGNVNCIHMVRLVEAEFARVGKKNKQAREHYIGAIRAAERSGHIQDAATGHECAAVFFLKNMNDPAMASKHILEAIRWYTKWGATAVVQRIEQSYGDLPELSLSQPATKSCTFEESHGSI